MRTHPLILEMVDTSKNMDVERRPRPHPPSGWHHQIEAQAVLKHPQPKTLRASRVILAYAERLDCMRLTAAFWNTHIPTRRRSCRQIAAGGDRIADQSADRPVLRRLRFQQPANFVRKTNGSPFASCQNVCDTSKEADKCTALLSEPPGGKNRQDWSQGRRHVHTAESHRKIALTRCQHRVTLTDVSDEKIADLGKATKN
jgi:hypothetical protein